MPVRPSSLYDREAEWEDLSRFVSAPGPDLRLGIVYGRRRFGKSFLLRRLVEAVGGVYHLALREERRPALDRFAAASVGSCNGRHHVRSGTGSTPWSRPSACWAHAGHNRRHW